MPRLALLVLIFLPLGLNAGSEPATKPSVETYFHNFSESDVSAGRPTYEYELLMLALEKTRRDFGDFQLKNITISTNINQARSIELLHQHQFPNYTRTLGYQSRLTRERDLIFVPFPAYLGVMSYRTCFTSAAVEARFAEVDSLDNLRKFTFVSGIGWSDTLILRHNRLRVREISSYDSMFQMTALNRGVDLFCRGASEVLPEMRERAALTQLRYDKRIAIFYPQPLFFYLHKGDQRAAERLLTGLRSAYSDGSLRALWDRRFKESVDFVNLSARRIIALESPLVKDLNLDYTQYNFRPDPSSRQP